MYQGKFLLYSGENQARRSSDRSEIGINLLLIYIATNSRLSTISLTQSVCTLWFGYFLTSLAVSHYLFPVSQSNSSLKKHRSRSIFSPFFCCFRNYNDYHVEPPPTNNKTLSLPPPPEENGSPPKVKLICLLHHTRLARVQIYEKKQEEENKLVGIS